MLDWAAIWCLQGLWRCQHDLTKHGHKTQGHHWHPWLVGWWYHVQGHTTCRFIIQDKTANQGSFLLKAVCIESYMSHSLQWKAFEMMHWLAESFCPPWCLTSCSLGLKSKPVLASEEGRERRGGMGKEGEKGEEKKYLEVTGVVHRQLVHTAE